MSWELRIKRVARDDHLGHIYERAQALKQKRTRPVVTAKLQQNPLQLVIEV